MATTGEIMKSCRICKTRRVAKRPQTPNHDGLCYTCSLIDDSVRIMEGIFQEKAPKGHSIILDWELVKGEVERL